MIEDLALMQDDNIVAGLDLVDQMGCPKHANALARDKAPHMLEDVRAGLDIETGGRLVKQQHARAMQQRAGDFHPAHLAAGKVARLFARAIRHLDLVQNKTCPQLCFLPGNPVQ